MSPVELVGQQLCNKVSQMLTVWGDRNSEGVLKEVFSRRTRGIVDIKVLFHFF